MSQNQHVTDAEMAKIRRLADFDLIMLISEIHDHGWKVGRRTLSMMPDGILCPECGQRIARDNPKCPKCRCVIGNPQRN